jgi:hypothetical protein
MRRWPIAAWRRKRWAGTAAETAGKAMDVGKAAAAAVRRRSAQLGASVRTVRLTGGPHTVLIFSYFIQNWLNFNEIKKCAYLAPKIRNICMRLAWDIMNKFLHYADIQFLT